MYTYSLAHFNYFVVTKATTERCFLKMAVPNTGADREILKKWGRRGGALYVDHHGWAGKKILGFRWSKTAEVTLETVFGKIFLSAFSNFLHFYR